MPATTRTAPARRHGPTRSRRSGTASAVAMTTLVSRTAATDAAGRSLERREHEDVRDEREHARERGPQKRLLAQARRPGEHAEAGDVAERRGHHAELEVDDRAPRTRRRACRPACRRRCSPRCRARARRLGGRRALSAHARAAHPLAITSTPAACAADAPWETRDGADDEDEHGREATRDRIHERAGRRGGTPPRAARSRGAGAAT